MRGSAILIGIVCMAVALVAPAARAQRDEDASSRAVAQVLINAMPETRYADWGFGWSPVGSRLSRRVSWHLAEPDEFAYRPPEDHHRRTGWISTDGVQVAIAACGAGKDVEALAFRLTGFERAEQVIAALRAEGATVEQNGASYAVSASGRTPGELFLEENCTSPRSAAAQRCWLDGEFRLKPIARAIGCQVPGRS